MTRTIDGLPVVEFAFPGTLRDSLVAAILRGEKTSTSTLLVDYERDGESAPGGRRARGRGRLRRAARRADRDDRGPGAPLGEVDLAFAREEGEGFETVAEWRAAHERFWASYLPDVEIDDGSLVVAERFACSRRFGQQQT